MKVLHTGTTVEALNPGTLEHTMNFLEKTLNITCIYCILKDLGENNVDLN